jgi:hypothetical protein
MGKPPAEVRDWPSVQRAQTAERLARIMPADALRPTAGRPANEDDRNPDNIRFIEYGTSAPYWVARLKRDALRDPDPLRRRQLRGILDRLARGEFRSVRAAAQTLRLKAFRAPMSHIPRILGIHLFREHRISGSWATQTPG